MFIHRCKFQGHVKLLLRSSYRMGNTVKKFTVASVTCFSSQDLALLEDLLSQRRAAQRQDRHPFDSQIFALLLANVPPDKQWRLRSTPTGVRRLAGDPVYDFRPMRASKVGG